MNTRRGFSLIELLVSLLIISVLSITAVGGYQQIIDNTLRRQVLLALHNAASAIIHCYHNSDNGTQQPPRCDGDYANVPPALVSTFNTDAYTLSLAEASRSGFRISAAHRDHHRHCAVLVIDDAFVITAHNSSGSDVTSDCLY